MPSSYPKLCLLVFAFINARYSFRGWPRLIWVASETSRQLGSQRGNKHNTYRLSVAIGTRGKGSREFINGEDGKSGKTRKTPQITDNLKIVHKKLGSKWRKRNDLALRPILQVITDVTVI